MREKLLLLLTAALLPALALPIYGPRAMALGGAYVALADDEASVYYNPAGMAAAGDYFACVLHRAEGRHLARRHRRGAPAAVGRH
ncbi:MAG: hypothetical protein NTW26_02740 [bacterium]|nr:hypothetical protein [bacterium]